MDPHLLEIIIRVRDESKAALAALRKELQGVQAATAAGTVTQEKETQATQKQTKALRELHIENLKEQDGRAKVAIQQKAATVLTEKELQQAIARNKLLAAQDAYRKRTEAQAAADHAQRVKERIEGSQSIIKNLEKEAAATNAWADKTIAAEERVAARQEALRQREEAQQLAHDARRLVHAQGAMDKANIQVNTGLHAMFALKEAHYQKDINRFAAEAAAEAKSNGARVKNELETVARIAAARATLDVAEGVLKGNTPARSARVGFLGALGFKRDLQEGRNAIKMARYELNQFEKYGVGNLRNIEARVGRVTTGFSKLANILETNVKTGSEIAGRGFKNFSDHLSGSSSLLSRFGAIGTIAVIAIAPLIGAVIQLGAGLIAMGSAVLFAAAAIGGALVSAVAVALPGLFILAGVIKQIVQVFQISSQQQKNSIADSARAARGNTAHAAAIDQTAAASRRLQDAQKKLTDARREAIRNLQDLILKEKEARLRAIESNFSVIEAQRSLQQAVAGGDVFAVRSAQFALADAKLSDQQGTVQNTRDFADNKVTKAKGVEGSDVVVAAKRDLTDATKALTKAQEGQATSANQAALADFKATEAVKRLTPEQKKLLEAVNALKLAFQTTLGATLFDPALASFTKLVKGITRMLKDPEIVGALQGVSKALGKMLDSIFGTFTGKQGKQFILFFSGIFKQIGPQAGKDIGNLITFFQKVAVAATPVLLAILKGFSGFTDRLSKIKPKTLSDFFDTAMKSLKPVTHLLQAFLGFLGRIIGAAAPSGNGLIEQLAHFFDNAAKDPAKTKKFFDDAAKGMKTFGEALTAIGAALVSPGGQKALTQISELFRDVLAPALKIVIGFSNGLFQLLDKIASTKAGKTFLEFGLAGLIIFKTIPGMGIVFKLIIPLIRLFFSVIAGILPILGSLGKIFVLLARMYIPILITAIRTLGVAMLTFVTGNPILVFALLVVAALIFLQLKFHIFQRFILPAIKYIYEWIKDHWKKIGETLLALSGPIGLMILFIIKHFDKIKDLFKKLIGFFQDRIKGGWTGLWDDFKSVVSKIAGKIGRIFDDMVNTVIRGLNKLIEGVNSFLKLMGKVPGLGFLGKLEIGRIAYVGGTSDNQGVGPHADGGFIQAKAGGGRVIRVAEGGYDELVLSTDPNKKHRTAALMSEFERRTAAPFANGGFVGARFNQSVGGGTTTGDIGDPPPTNTPRGGGGSNIKTKIGRIAAIIREANAIAAMNLPYSYGGGHNGPPAHPSTGITSPSGRNYSNVVGFDCSSSVSRVMQEAYPGFPTLSSGQFLGDSHMAPGVGSVTTWGGPGHVFMDILGERWGTGGGARGGFAKHGHTTDKFKPAHVKDLEPSKGGHGLFDKVLGGLKHLGSGAFDAFAKVIDLLSPDKIRKMLSVVSDNPIVQGIAGFVRDKAVDAAKGVLGFKDGGDVPGAEGVPRLILAHGGERVTSVKDRKAQQKYLRYVREFAKKYNLDPQAMMAVAFSESGLDPNNIGDGGTSFGYHQLRIGGALGNISKTAARKYLDPRKNLELASRLIAQAGGSGLRGADAINQIVRKFERPAAPGSEVARALAYYNNNSGSSGSGGGSTTTTKKKVVAEDSKAKKLLKTLADDFSPSDLIASLGKTVGGKNGLLRRLLTVSKVKLEAALGLIENRMTAYFAAMTDGLAKFATTIEKGQKSFARTVASKTFTVGADGVVTLKDYSEGDKATDSVGELKTERNTLNQEMAQINTSLATANGDRGKLITARNKIKKMLDAKWTSGRHKGKYKVTGKARAKLQAIYDSLGRDIQQADTAIAGLTTAQGDTQDALNANAASAYEAQQAVFPGKVFDATNKNNRDITTQDIKLRLAQATGDVAGQKAAITARGGDIQSNIDALTKLLADPTLTIAQRQDLLDAIDEQKIALIDNTKSLDELTAVQTELQDFSTSSWQQFRTAVFNGTGGLMPQYVPPMDTGGTILRDGLIYGHSGEEIMPANVTRSSSWRQGGDTSINIQVDQAGQDLDVQALARRLAFEQGGLR